MRIRQIKPGIMSNEEIVELGPFAYILFTGLWMIADREGRFEWRPRRIKALVLPLWDECDAQAVGDLLDSLWKTGFLHSYESGGKRYGAVVNWSKHQNPDPRETSSKIPPPPSAPGVTADVPVISEKTVELHRQDNGTPVSCRVGNGYMGNGYRRLTASNPRAREDSTGVQQQEPPPPGTELEPDAQTAGQRPRKPRSSVDVPGPITPPAPKPRRKGLQPPGTPHGMRHARECVPRGASDWWPYQPEDVETVRESMRQLGEMHGLPPPDDAMVRKVLDAGRGASGTDIHRVLVELWKREKFRDIRSWGLLPVVIGHICSTPERTAEGRN